MKLNANEENIRFQLPPKACEYFGSSLFLCRMPNGRLLFSRAKDLENMKKTFKDVYPDSDAAYRFAFADVIELPLEADGVINIPKYLWKHLGPGKNAAIRFGTFGVELWGEQEMKL